MYILGISAFYHDSAAALLKDGVLIAAAQEERFTRKKHDPSFPTNAIRYCLDEACIDLDQVEWVAFYDKPFIKFERLLETYYAFAPRGVVSFLKSMPVWIKEKLLLKDMLRKELAEISPSHNKQIRLLFPEHHLSHAASAFYPSPFNEAAILTLDGVGEWATASICHGKGNQIELLKEMHFPHSIGLSYSAFTYYLGFRVNSGEYKLMGLAPYGNPGSPRVKEFIQKIKENLIQIYEDGSVWLNQDYFDYATGLKMVRESKWEKLFGIKVRKPEDDMSAEHCDLALAIQQVTEEIVILMAKHARSLTSAEYLCLAGGVALNCVANGELLRSGIFKDIWIQPAAGDAGGAVGAAFCVHHLKENCLRVSDDKTDRMSGSYLGPEFSDKEIEKSLRRYQAVMEKTDSMKALCDKTARLISEGNVVGWFQGRMEFGPRALGNRSILADPRNPEMQKKLNLKIKYREGFRPFAPSVLEGNVADYFELDRPSPYMLLIAGVKESRRIPVPRDYHDQSWKEKLYFLRSDLPSITHIDYSARIQSVSKQTNPVYHQLISSFFDLTGVAVLVNTSFNVRGEPIVCTPEDAYRCFMRTEMDYLVVGPYLLNKKQQPVWKDKKDWKSDYVLD